MLARRPSVSSASPSPPPSPSRSPSRSPSFSKRSSPPVHSPPRDASPLVARLYRSDSHHKPRLPSHLKRKLRVYARELRQLEGNGEPLTAFSDEEVGRLLQMLDFPYDISRWTANELPVLCATVLCRYAYPGLLSSSLSLDALLC